MPRHLLIAVVGLLLAGAGSAAPAGPSLDPAAWRGDARFLAAAIDSIHPQPHVRYKAAAWDSAAADLERRLPTLRYAQAVAGFSRMLAMLDDGHSRLDQVRLASHAEPVLAPLAGPGFDRFYPVGLGVFSDGLWVVRTPATHADLLGMRVEAIDGHPVAEVVAALTPEIPEDSPMWTLEMLPAFLSVPGYLSAAGLCGPTDPLRLTLGGARGGARRDVALAAAARDSTVRWIEADAAVRTPLPPGRALPAPYAFADLDDSTHTVYARIREIGNEGRETLAEFTGRLYAHVDSIGARRLVIDLRGNGGGNGYLNQPLWHGVIRRPVLDRTGGTFVIVDRGTFSAAVALACDFERETHAVFVGEPTGGAPNSPGDPAHVTLPASGIVVRISTVLWSGSDPRDPRRFLAPDLPARLSFDDWLHHRDPALAAIEAYRPPAREPDVQPNAIWQTDAKQNARVPRTDW